MRADRAVNKYPAKVQCLQYPGVADVEMLLRFDEALVQMCGKHIKCRYVSDTLRVPPFEGTPGLMQVCSPGCWLIKPPGGNILVMTSSEFKLIYKIEEAARATSNL